MLQEAAKVITSAFKGGFTKNLSLYLHDCLREEVQSSSFRNLKQDKDNKWHFLKGEENILFSESLCGDFDGADKNITELMVQAEASKKDRYLIYGYLFLTGKNSRRKRATEFLTPLLYSPCKLERNGMTINCNITEESLSLNTGALAELMKSDDEDETENLFEGLIDVVPELPLDPEKLSIFITTLRSLVPDLSTDFIFMQNPETEISETVITDQRALILTKRPNVTAGVLHELKEMAQMSKGTFRETSLSPIEEEYTHSEKSLANKSKIEFDKREKSKDKDFIPIVPLSLSETQKDVIRSCYDSTFLTVYGPPGTGKSQTIVNLVCDLVANDKKVLVVSRMDKAVDVVASRLNSFGAPFLAMRAGRTDYQRELQFKLQDLLSNKIDLKTGFEEAVLVNKDDSKNLHNAIRDIENKCETILNLECDWAEKNEELAQKTQTLGKKAVINADLYENELKKAEKILDKINLYQEKSGGFFGGILRFLDERKLKKLLALDKKYKFNPLSIDLLYQNLEVKKLEIELKKIEIQINKTGVLSALLGNLKKMRERQKALSINILKKKRRDALMNLMKDQSKRQRLLIHSKMLVERKKNLQNRVLQDEDFTPLLEAFPCWAVTTFALSESLPLKPALFDVVIVDEASQCDIASCFPALFRAKNAVIVGDDKQLAHLSFLDKTKEQSFLSQYNVPDKYQLMWRFRTNSIFDIAQYYSLNPILLDEHFRSHPPIIEFSNNEFYGGRIKVVTKEIGVPDCLDLKIVKGAKADLDETRNTAEVEAIIDKMQEVIRDSDESNPISIGVISPFRAQVECIKKAIMQVFDSETTRKHHITVGTAHTFQGDERDVMLLSWTIAENSHFQSIMFAQKPNLFNVAITRARKKLFCFISREIKDLPAGLLRDFLEYIERIKKLSQKERLNSFKSSLEKQIAKECEKANLRVLSGFRTAGYEVGLVVEDKKGNIAAIECDGDLKDVCLKKQEALERCGWNVLRITTREWSYSPKNCIERIKTLLDS